MLVKTIISRHRAILLAFLTVALVATGYARRMPDASDQALAFAMANDATAADLCGGRPGKTDAGSLARLPPDGSSKYARPCGCIPI